MDFHVVNATGDGYDYRLADADNGVWFYSDYVGNEWQRSGFSVNVDYYVHYNDNGEWYNYTRVFTNSYYAVYARLASPVGLAAELSLITSDPTQPGQTTQLLGAFTYPGTAGWTSFTTAQFTNAAGQPLCVRLSDTRTLRLTMRNDARVNWLAFVPVPASEVPRPVLSISHSGDNAIVSWTGEGFKLQSKTGLSGIWEDVAGGASSPTTVPVSGPAKFFRLTD